MLPPLEVFNAEFARIQKDLNKYDEIAGDVRPRGGLIVSRLNVEVAGREELTSTVALRKMRQLAAEIKADDAVLTELQKKIEEVQRRHDALIQSIKNNLKESPECLVYLHDDRKATMKGFPAIGECNCSSQLTRVNGSLRKRFTSRLDAAVSRIDTKSQVTLCSIGSGACFHELEIHACLSDRYNIKWVLIDTKYTPRFPYMLEAPKVFDLLARTISSSVEVEVYSNAKEYFEQASCKPDVIMLIDVEEEQKTLDLQPFRQKQKEVGAKGHTCLLAILNKWNRDEPVEILED